jgi:hypothetical protein
MNYSDASILLFGQLSSINAEPVQGSLRQFTGFPAFMKDYISPLLLQSGSSSDSSTVPTGEQWIPHSSLSKLIPVFYSFIGTQYLFRECLTLLKTDIPV